MDDFARNCIQEYSAKFPKMTDEMIQKDLDDLCKQLSSRWISSNSVTDGCMAVLNQELKNRKRSP